jgi:hemolysin-activating ACP:hemolysin acyltransferase
MASDKKDAPKASAGSTSAKAASGAPGNGAKGLGEAELLRRQNLSRRVLLTIGEIVSVFMRTKTHRQWSLAAAEQLIVPAIVTGQYAVAHGRSKESGVSSPVAVVIWASVSAEVDKKLAGAGSSPVSLQPKEWKGGDNLWLLEAVGDTRAIASLVKQLQERTWKGRPVKMRSRGADGKVVIKQLGK